MLLLSVTLTKLTKTEDNAAGRRRKGGERRRSEESSLPGRGGWSWDGEHAGTMVEYMKYMHIRYLLTLAAVLSGVAASAQTAEERAAEKARQLYETIDEQVEKDTKAYDLEDWQVFMIDSTLTHDYQALSAEYEQLSRAKVSNYSMYMQAQDKWAERTYLSYKNILNDEQWAKYLKSGAARAKKGRDRRAAKMAGK